MEVWEDRKMLNEMVEKWSDSKEGVSDKEATRREKKIAYLINSPHSPHLT